MTKTLSQSDVKVLRDILGLIRMKGTFRFQGEDYSEQGGEYRLGLDATNHLREMMTLSEKALAILDVQEAAQGVGDQHLHQGREKAIFDWFGDNGLAPPLHREVSDLLAAIDAAQPQGDFVMVPREPTQEMLTTILKACHVERGQTVDDLAPIIKDIQNEALERAAKELEGLREKTRQSRDRAQDAGREFVASHRQSDIETLDRAVGIIRQLKEPS